MTYNGSLKILCFSCYRHANISDQSSLQRRRGGATAERDLCDGCSTRAREIKLALIYNIRLKSIAMPCVALKILFIITYIFYYLLKEAGTLRNTYIQIQYIMIKVRACERCPQIVWWRDMNVTIWMCYYLKRTHTHTHTFKC